MKYLDRFQEVLINPTQEQMELRDPIMVFSFYLSGRVAVLSHFSAEILEHLDEGFSAQPLDGSRVERADSLMWLWLLGAYEIVRTMTQAEQCFSVRAMSELKNLKKILATARMPSAKMEKPGRRIPVTSDRSPSGWDFSSRDLLMGDPEAPVSARFLLSEFDWVLSSIGKGDVVAAHADSYEVRT